MQSEKINEASITPRTLTDKELISFAERYSGSNMPLSFQKELLARLDKRVNG